MNRTELLRTSLQREHVRAALIGVGVFTLLVAVFLLSPWDGGDDWRAFHGAAQRVLDRSTPLYGTPTFADYYYYNPPWLAVLLTPTAPFAARIGWGIVSAASLVIALALLRRWLDHPGYIKPVLVLLSPAMLYMLLHGQIDLLILAGVLLPMEWWGLVALTKPQTALGLVAMIFPHHWLRAAIILGVVAIPSVALLGPWPLDLLDQPRPFVEMGHNLWLNLWPFQIPVGVLLIVLGYSRKDERLLIAGSPFLSPYAAMSSMIGPWIAAITFLNDWQALAVFVSWWGAVILRALGG